MSQPAQCSGVKELNSLPMPFNSRKVCEARLIVLFLLTQLSPFETGASIAPPALSPAGAENASKAPSVAPPSAPLGVVKEPKAPSSQPKVPTVGGAPKPHATQPHTGDARQPPKVQAQTLKVAAPEARQKPRTPAPDVVPVSSSPTVSPNPVSWTLFFWN